MMEEKNKGIDLDVVEKMIKDNVMAVVSDQKEMNRAMLNCYCELYSQFKELNKAINEMYTLFSVISGDKVDEFFRKTRENFENEVKRVRAQEKIAQSHKKPKKSVK